MLQPFVLAQACRSLKRELCDDDATSHLDIACGGVLVLMGHPVLQDPGCPSDARKFQPGRVITTYIGPKLEAGKRPAM